MREDYVSFEVAKLLKEKGFDEPCIGFYNPIDGCFFEANIRKSWDYERHGSINAPTFQMAMKWLREKHNLHICIFIGEDYSTDADGKTVDKWQFWTYSITNIWGDMVYDAYDIFDCVEYQTYEEACEAAIKYCLENLI